jgi:hypothetical protein
MPKAKSRANVAFAEEYKRHKRDRTTDATISECMGYKGPDGYDRFKKKKARCPKAGLIQTWGRLCQMSLIPSARSR